MQPDEFLIWLSIPMIAAAWGKISQPLWEKLPPIILILIALGLFALGAKFYPRSWVGAIAFGLGIVIAAWRIL